MNKNDLTAEQAHSEQARAQLISSLADGELTRSQANAALFAAVQPEGLERWELYHLIGQAMREPQLASLGNPKVLKGVRAAMRESKRESARPSNHEASGECLASGKNAPGPVVWIDEAARAKHSAQESQTPQGTDGDGDPARLDRAIASGENADQNAGQGAAQSAGQRPEHRSQPSYAHSRVSAHAHARSRTHNKGGEPQTWPEPVALFGQVSGVVKAANERVWRWKLVSGFASVLAISALGWGVYAQIQAISRAPTALAAATVAPLPPSAHFEGAAPRPPGQGAHDSGAAAMLARAPQAQTAAQSQSVALGAPAPAPQDVMAANNDINSQMLQDPQIDQLLSEHRSATAFSGTTSSFLRNATFEELPR